MAFAAIALGVLIVAGLYLERLSGLAAAGWLMVGGAAAYLAFRTQGPLAAAAVLTILDAVLVLRVFEGDVALPPEAGTSLFHF